MSCCAMLLHLQVKHPVTAGKALDPNTSTTYGLWQHSCGVLRHSWVEALGV
jgi:hypothetical protein